MFPKIFCPSPIQNFAEWESSQHFFFLFWINIQRRFQNIAICFPFKISLSGKVPTVLSFFFFWSPFLTRFFSPFSFLSFFFFSQTNFPSHFHILPPPPPTLIISSHLATVADALATANPLMYKLFPLQPPPTTTTILFPLFFGVQVSLKCKFLCFGLWVCFDLVFL